MIKYFQKLYIIFLGIIISVSTSNSLASSPISKVGGSVVNEGQTDIGFRFGFTDHKKVSSRKNRFQTRQHIDYGFNGWYALRLILSQDKRDQKNSEHRGFTIENRFQLIEKRDYGWDGGLRLQYTHSDGDKTPHEIDFRLMAQVPVSDKVEWRKNIVLEHDIGENSKHGLHLEFRNILSLKTESPTDGIKGLKLGVESFNDFGRLRDGRTYDEQDHQIGPVILGKFGEGFYFETGYRLGLSNAAPDHLLKLSIGRKF